MSAETAGVVFAEKIMVLKCSAGTAVAAVEEWSSSNRQEEVVHLVQGSSSCYRISLEFVALTQGTVG